MIKSDYHIHTCFSGDSTENIENIISTSLDKSLNEICITDHQDFDFLCDDILFELDIDDYFNTVTSYRDKYANKIRIKRGLEIGLEPDKASRINNFITKKPFDFIIGSSHLVNGLDPYYPSYFQGKTEKQAIIEYFESILNNLKVCNNFDVYGHIDYVVRYAPSKDENYSYLKYREIIDEILITLISKDKGIEINTSGLKSGLKYPNPCPDIIKRYKELGGKIITIGSDAHSANYIAYEFSVAENILMQCGFDYYNTFTNRIPEFVKINCN